MKHEMSENHLSTALTVKFSDVKFHTVMDTGFFGLFRMTPEMHTHPYFEIQAVISGSYSIEFLNNGSDNDNIVQMENDTLCLIPPACYHSSQAVSDKPEKLALRFSFEPFDNGEILTTLYSSFNAAFSKITYPTVIHSSELCQLMLNIHKELASPKPGAEIMAQLYIGQFYIELLRLLHFYDYNKTSKKSNVGDSDNSRYNQIEWYFGDHFAEQITEDNLAAALKLSKRQVSRILQKIYGMSFREKLISIRMSNAAKLLVRTELPIEQVAASVGYSTTSGFFTAFKKQYGMSGIEYRKQNRNSR